MQGVTNRCRLSWLTNSALIYEPKCGGGGVAGQWVQLCTWSPNKLWRTNFKFNLWLKVSQIEKGFLPKKVNKGQNKERKPQHATDSIKTSAGVSCLVCFNFQPVWIRNYLIRIQQQTSIYINANRIKEAKPMRIHADPDPNQTLRSQKSEKTYCTVPTKVKMPTRNQVYQYRVFVQFPCSWIWIRILITDPNTGQPNKCGSKSKTLLLQGTPESPTACDIGWGTPSWPCETQCPPAHGETPPPQEYLEGKNFKIHGKKIHGSNIFNGIL